MEITDIKKEEILNKSKELNALSEYLKNEFIGIDSIIDGVIDSMRPYYLFPESLAKPIVINLWGMTGTGKTSLVEKIVDFLKLKKSFIKYDMGTNNSEYGFMSIFKKTTSNNNVIVLDEFQIGRTIDEQGKEKDNGCRYIWDLVDSGKITAHKNYEVTSVQYELSDIENVIKDGTIKVDENGIILNVEDYLERSFMTISANGSDMILGQKIKPNQRLYLNKDVITEYKITGLNFINHDFFGRLVKANPEFFNYDDSVKNRDKFFKKPLKEIMDTLEKCIETFEQIRVYDYSKSIIFCLGNLDEIYAMSKNTNPDYDADMFHENSLKINLMNVKGALQTRFRVEQISRLGNNHFIYPAFNRNSYEKFISKYLINVQDRILEQFNLKINFDKSVNEIIYKEGVFPAQGIRPLFSTLRNYIDNNLAVIITDLIMNHDTTESIIWEYSNKKFFIKTGSENLFYDVETKLEDLRKIDNPQTQAVVAVHESGHALISSLLLGEAPEEILSKTASSDAGGYCLYKPKDEYKTKEYLLKTIKVLLAGFEAEKLIFGEENVSIGSYNDFGQATNIAVNIVKVYGFNGVSMHISADCDMGNGGMRFLKTSKYDLDSESIIKKAQEEVASILFKHKKDLLRLSEVLIKKPKIFKEEVKEILSNLNIDWKDEFYFDFSEKLNAEIKNSNLIKNIVENSAVIY